MKPLVLHPMSALAGAGVLALVLLGSGVAAPQGIAQAVTTQRMFIENVLDMNSYPNPRDYVVIREGTPYVVPAGKILVFTALGGATDSGRGQLSIDGVDEVIAHNEIGGTSGVSGPATSVKLLPPGLSASAGTTVEVDNGVGKGRAWGYLADA